MTVALDATYSVTNEPSGVAVYSREILDGLKRLYPEDEYVRCYRWKQWRRCGFRGRPLLPPVPTFQAHLFHALNQRVDRRPSKHVICTFHDLFVMTADYSTPEYRERFAQQARIAARNSDMIIAVSRFTADQVQEVLGIPCDRIRVVPHGVHRPSQPRIASDPPFILSVGAIQRRKNTGNLVRAFEHLPSNWHLVLAGSASGYGADEILKQIESSAAADRIEVTGYASPARLRDLYASASIFAFPSLDEGFGIPVLEAMANGIPVLTSNRSGTKEIAAGAAVLVDPLSVEEITNGLCRLVEDEDLRTELSLAGRKRSEEYTWDRAVSDTHAIYRELAS